MPMAVALSALAAFLAVSAPATVPSTAERRPAPPRVIINIPAARVRVYRGDALVLDVPTAVGRRDYPGREQNTKTRVGTYRIGRWIRAHRSDEFPVRWTDDPWRGAFGAWAATLEPRSAAQHVHGTLGPMELAGAYLVRPPPPPRRPDETLAEWLRGCEAYDRGLSHGCTRLANADLEAFKALCPAGTPVRKVYCLHERLSPVNPWDVRDVWYPNLYGYRLTGEPCFYPETGRLEGYSDPPDAKSGGE